MLSERLRGTLLQVSFVEPRTQIWHCAVLDVRCIGEQAAAVKAEPDRVQIGVWHTLIMSKCTRLCSLQRKGGLCTTSGKLGDDQNSKSKCNTKWLPSGSMLVGCSSDALTTSSVNNPTYKAI